MLYREVGQFKTNYSADQAIFPIRQDLIVVIAMIAVAYLAIPFLASEYWFEVILLPILVFSLAALGLNVLTGYCGQSLSAPVDSWRWEPTRRSRCRRRSPT